MSTSAKIAAGAAAVLLLLPVLLTAAVGGTISAVFGGSSTPSQVALADIPADYLTLYQRAAAVCPGLDWSILAEIGKIETDHGRSTLLGVHQGENPYHAAGFMQIVPSTWDGVLTRHQIPPGGSTPPSRHNPHDSIHAAAFLLCDNNVNRDLRAAIFAYNHANWYVDRVLTQAAHYRTLPAAGTPGAIRLDWPPEQATIPDPTSAGRITPRTHALLRDLQANGMTGNGIGCFAHRPANPDSDHPQGRACDIMFNPHDQRSVNQGWAIAQWLIANQARYGISYLIWQGQYWSAHETRWVPYASSIYGCPNPANLTGCHYDHIHWSVA